MRGPSRQSRLPDETQGETKAGWGLGVSGGGRKEGGVEGELVEEFGVVEKTGGEKKKKTMRQNQKINEALFQWQDLCTVNISLAIRGNPITLCLSSPFSL